MATPLLTTKLYIPSPLPNLVERPHLVKRLEEGLSLGHRLTLISAPASFGKTTLLSEWVHAMGRISPPIAFAWLSLDEHDNDPARFLAYFIAALGQAEGIEATIGEGALGMLQSPQPPPTEVLLTVLINEIAAIPDRVVLVLDDYHLIESSSFDNALTFLLEHLPRSVIMAYLGIVFTSFITGAWWPLIAYVVYFFSMFGVFEIRFLCSHCPYYAETGNILHCLANHGSFKFWRYHPESMNKFEQFMMYVLISTSSSSFRWQLQATGCGRWPLNTRVSGYSRCWAWPG